MAERKKKKEGKRRDAFHSSLGIGKGKERGSK